MPINEVLGYINYFLEQNNAKVLIIANEKEIGSIQPPDISLLELLITTQDLVNRPKSKKNESCLPQET